MKRRSLESAEKGPVPLWRQMTKGSSPRWFLFLRFFHWLVHTQWADACYKVVATISFGEFVTFFFQYSPSVGAKVTDAPCLTLQYFCIKRENGFNVFGIINERLDWYSFCRKRAAPCGLPLFAIEHVSLFDTCGWPLAFFDVERRRPLRRRRDRILMTLSLQTCSLYKSVSFYTVQKQRGRAEQLRNIFATHFESSAMNGGITKYDVHRHWYSPTTPQ